MCCRTCVHYSFYIFVVSSRMSYTITKMFTIINYILPKPSMLVTYLTHTILSVSHIHILKIIVIIKSWRWRNGLVVGALWHVGRPLLLIFEVAVEVFTAIFSQILFLRLLF